MAQSTTLPGDHVVPDAAMIYDRTRLVKARPEIIFPWLVQVGKGRGGWYLPSFWEQLLPRSWRASRKIEAKWQTLGVGDRVADYGKYEWFEVVSIDPPHSLVFTSERFGTVFTWALLLHPKTEDVTEVHLRFLGRIHSLGWRRRLIIFGGDVLDWATASPMLAGLAERVERTHTG
jgi:hypothetical protein